MKEFMSRLNLLIGSNRFFIDFACYLLVKVNYSYSTNLTK